MEPFFSIVLPTYNRRDQLERCLQSVKKQYFSDYEIILVDDGSTDDTRMFIDSAYPDVRYYYQMNQGVSRARNVGIQKANGRYIAFLDSDDIWYRSRLKIMHAAITALPSTVGLIFNDMDRIVDGIGDGRSYSDQYFGIDRRHVIAAMHRSDAVNSSDGNIRIRYGDIFARLLHGNIISPPCAVMKTAVFKKLGQFREDFRVANDSEYFLRISKHYQIGYIDKILTSIDPPRTGISLSSSANSIEKINNMIQVIDTYYQAETDQELKMQLKLRLANLHGLLGYHYLSEYKGRMARSHYAYALRSGPLNIKFWLMFFVTFLPAALLRVAAGAKQVLKQK